MSYNLCLEYNVCIVAFLVPSLVNRETCCFGALHIKTGTYIVAIFELAIAIIGLFVAVGNIAHDYQRRDTTTR